MATKKDMEARIAELENQLKSQPSLTEALLDAGKVSASARRLAQEATNEKLYEVRSLISVTVSAEITDSHGTKKRVMWPVRGSVQLLTASQISEIIEHKDFFEAGYLATDLIPSGPNAVEDYEKFISELSVEDVRSRVQLFTSTGPLFALYHFLENKRYVMEGTESKEVDLSPKEQVVYYAVMERLRELAGFNFATHGTE